MADNKKEIIKVTCPNGHRLAAQLRKAGQTVSCPVCGVRLVVPVPEERKCSDSAVLKILGIKDSLREAAEEVQKSEFLADSQRINRANREAKNTQICPQCDWEIDAGYKICPHCHYYLAQK